MPRFTPLLACALLLATASLAHAQPAICAGGEAAPCIVDSGDGTAIGRPLRSRSLGRGDAPRPTPQEPYRGLQAVAYPLARLGLFARSEGFSLGRRSQLSDVEGGAVLQLDDGLGLTATYRMFGAGVGFDSLLLGAGGKAVAAPFVSLVLDF